MLPLCRFHILSGIVLTFVFVGTACSPKLEPRVYDAPKVDTVFIVPPPANRAAPPRMGANTIPLQDRRILGAIIPYPGEAFYLKAVDRIERLDSVESDFRSVVEKFAIDETTKRPTLLLPPGWTLKMRETDNEFVMADILASSTSELPIKFTVSVLGVSDWDNDLLRNVDRWRGQLELPPTDLESIKREMPSIARGDSPLPAYIFDATAAGIGKSSIERSKSQADSGAPDASPSTPSSSLSEPSPPPANAGSMEPPKIVAYDKPDHWMIQAPKTLRLLSFNVANEDRVGEVIVSWVKHVPLENASLWCEQVLKDTDPATIATAAAKTVAEAEDIPSGNAAGKLYSIRASDEPNAATLLVAAIPTGTDDMCMFVKLKCDLRMSEQEKSNLLSFVNSLRWE